MTYKDAIETLKKRICCEFPVEHFCTDDCRSGDEYCAVALAIRALELQVRERPHYVGEVFDGSGEVRYNMWVCPHCGTYYKLDRDVYSHCPTCGQAIDGRKKA